MKPEKQQRTVIEWVCPKCRTVCDEYADKCPCPDCPTNKPKLVVGMEYEIRHNGGHRNIQYDGLGVISYLNNSHFDVFGNHFRFHINQHIFTPTGSAMVLLTIEERKYLRFILEPPIFQGEIAKPIRQKLEAIDGKEEA